MAVMVRKIREVIIKEVNKHYRLSAIKCNCFFFIYNKIINIYSNEHPVLEISRQRLLGLAVCYNR